ncbi:hypothetical protein B0H63DRAFT_510709 [Podospora didyma]|uniref:Uncharacterized protein n=1 Tax=Podospora didyma TaxID=330526 RepID=A0AAE0NR04_9PEZI|nr:hypothetical protein B0H63DRAFT_510709 [Podospora didyma]
MSMEDTFAFITRVVLIDANSINPERPGFAVITKMAKSGGQLRLPTRLGLLGPLDNFIRRLFESTLVKRFRLDSTVLGLPSSSTGESPKKLLYDIDILIKGSFEAGRWSISHASPMDLIINSSLAQPSEVKTLHDFLSNLDISSAAVYDAQNFEIAVNPLAPLPLSTSRRLSRASTMTSSIPNLIQKDQRPASRSPLPMEIDGD